MNVTTTLDHRNGKWHVVIEVDDVEVLALPLDEAEGMAETILSMRSDLD